MSDIYQEEKNQSQPADAQSPCKYRMFDTQWFGDLFANTPAPPSSIQPIPSIITSGFTLSSITHKLETW